MTLLLALLASTALAKPDPAVTTLAGSSDGMRLRVDVPADAEAWQGLVAVPAGKRAELLTTAASIELGQPAVLHGMQIVPLSVAPAADGVRSREVALSFTADPGAVAPRRTKIARSFANLLEAEVIGAAALLDGYQVVPGTYLAVVSSATGAMGAVQPLLDWRRKQGYNVIAASTAETGTSTTQIKSYIQQVYDTADEPLVHICLVGDANGGVAVASWRESRSGYQGEGDHYYTELEGNDVLSDALIGRLSARNVPELEGIVAKILEYEQNPDTFSNPEWYTSALLVGDSSASGTSTIYVNQWLKEQHLERLNYTRIDTVWSGPFASQITQKFNQGISVYSYRGYLGCSGFSTGYIDNLQNQGELPFAVMPTCASGSFMQTHAYTEAMLRNPHGGAIGAVGTATTGTHTRYNNAYFHGVWEGAMGEPDRTLGYAHNRGKIELYRQYGGNELVKVEIWSVWNNLMGDSATEMRQALPTTPVVSYPAQLPPDAGTLPVTVMSAGLPLEGAQVTVYREGAIQVVARTDAAGQVLLSLPAGAAAGELSVTVTGDDLVPHRGQTMLGAVTAYCVEDGWTWDDGQDGMPDPGETGDLTITVRNLGQQTAGQVSVNLASQTAGVGVGTGVVDLGDLAAGASTPAGPWSVILPDDLPDGASAVLSLTANSGADAWLSRVDLPVSAPAFTIVSASFDGQPGDTGLLSVSLRNDGSVMAPGGMAGFASASSLLLPAGPVDADLGDVAPGATVAVAYDILVSGDAFNGHLASCTLTVTSATGTRQVLDMPVTVGSVNADSPVGNPDLPYLAWDSQDPSPDAPVFAWREIDPNYGGDGVDVGLSDFGYEQDDTDTFDLPFSFLFNGVEYDQISICSNGWIAFGQTYLVHWRNWGLPAAGTPDNMVCVFWDNLAQASTNRVYHEYDADEGVYVVQWSRMRNLLNGLQNCQLILHDTAMHPTATGDGLMVFQYEQATNNDNQRGYATVGLQDGDLGINYTYYNRYAPGARTMQSNMAIAWVPVAEQISAAITVATESIDAILMPGQTVERTLEIDSTGPVGSVLNWQLTLQEASGLLAAGGESRDPSLDLTAPNGGETWLVGQIRTFTWDASADVNLVRLLVDRGQGFELLASDVDASLGSWPWLVTGPASDNCRARVLDQNNVLIADNSDADFSITQEFSWITLSEQSGQTLAGETASVTVTLDATGLPVGQYTVDLVILSSGGSPITVPVNLLVDTSTATPDLPASLQLAQNAPNPFNPRTSIAFALPRDTHVQLTVHDLRGRLVRTLASESMPAGHHDIAFDGTSNDGRRLASGTYIYRLVTSNQILTGRMTMVK